MPISSRPSSGTVGVRSRPSSAAAPPPSVFIDKGPKYLRMLDEQRNTAAGRIKVSREKPFDLIGSTDDELRACLRKFDGFIRGRMSFGLCLKSRADLETLYFEHHPTGRVEWDFVRRERLRLARADADEHEREVAVHEAELEAEAAELALIASLDEEEAAEVAAALELAKETAREEIEIVRLNEAEEVKEKAATGERRRSSVPLLDLSPITGDTIIGETRTAVAAAGGGSVSGGGTPTVSQLRIKINN